MTGFTRRTALALGAALAAPRLAHAQATQLAIATGTTGGVYYPLGGALANILSRNIPGLSATVEVTGGSVANNQLLGAGRVGMIFTQVDASVDAVRGEDRFRGRPVKVRAIAVLYTNRMQVVTTAATGINTMADLKGKRVSTGAPGSATEVMAFRLIEGAGLDREKDFRARERLSPAESTNAIKDGKLDAYFFVSGVPTSAVTDLGASPGITLKLVDHAEFVPKIVAKHGPVYFPEVIPAGTYPGQTTDNHQMSVANILAVLDTMPDEQVKKILEVTWGKRAELAQVHAEGRNFTLDKQKTAAAGVPWHPAAEAFWKAQGAQLG
ncbi:C4-dicarboxylate ABC transporter substrate-binding protein [Siccirubricoccus deserti]|uniref:TAXI family TRAP transporter solute-binding subunit n=1 Tax=Siccirubricoccus deserti TaxID=2013562 RepID=A0A9X0QUK3_9PROT|nr:TAXI family TRAP transporter solute-binding subunit [Siccirubricoccus deserti]MBC4014075.1 TAXI family TRAP transporter solute-binding subunit [Siccirubricoccus deserti]GGC26245.1 C4-dicarboxylate ABC transporter substrate-binding protein [Siccirubricoccus deserti]